jgi:hypothetical protein
MKEIQKNYKTNVAFLYAFLLNIQSQASHR